MQDAAGQVEDGTTERLDLRAAVFRQGQRLDAGLEVRLGFFDLDDRDAFDALARGLRKVSEMIR